MLLFVKKSSCVSYHRVSVLLWRSPAFDSTNLGGAWIHLVVGVHLIRHQLVKSCFNITPFAL